MLRRINLEKKSNPYRELVTSSVSDFCRGTGFPATTISTVHLVAGKRMLIFPSPSGSQTYHVARLPRMWYRVYQGGTKWHSVFADRKVEYILFSGSYIHSIDQKCRAAMPSKFRDMLENRFMLTKGPDGCLWVLSNEQWQLLIDKASQSIPIQRFFLASAVENKLAGKGRFLIPDVLREHADIKPGDDVMIIGLGNRIELWSRRRWETVSSQVTSDRIRCELPEFFLF